MAGRKLKKTPRDWTQHPVCSNAEKLSPSGPSCSPYSNIVQILLFQYRSFIFHLEFLLKVQSFLYTDLAALGWSLRLCLPGAARAAGTRGAGPPVESTGSHGEQSWWRLSLLNTSPGLLLLVISFHLPVRWVTTLLPFYSPETQAQWDWTTLPRPWRHFMV